MALNLVLVSSVRDCGLGTAPMRVHTERLLPLHALEPCVVTAWWQAAPGGGVCVSKGVLVAGSLSR